MICYGLRSISAVLRKAGHETQIFYLLSNVNDEPLYTQKTLEQLTQMVEGSDLIGVSCMAYTSERCKQVVTRLGKLDIPIIWGGVHATLDPEDCLGYANMVCVGEGEGTMLELVSRYEAGEDWKNIPNIGFLENGQVVVNEVRPLIQNLAITPVSLSMKHIFCTLQGVVSRVAPIAVMTS
jgi:radical SAM superfamily enzyme YgiQ (UPF0313 family)